MSARAFPRLALDGAGSDGGGGGFEEIEPILAAVAHDTNADIAYAVTRYGAVAGVHAPGTSPFSREGIDITVAASLGDVASRLVKREVLLLEPHTAV